MKREEIESGGTYVVKTAITGQITTRVFARADGGEYPFEISAARYGVKAEEIFPLTKAGGVVE